MGHSKGCDGRTIVRRVRYAVEGRIPRIPRLNTMLTTLITVALTIYTGPIAAPLYCDTGHGLTYTTTATWIAWDFAVHGGQCGDIIEVIADGQRRTFPALDSGRFGRHCVQTVDGCLPIMADLPQHLAWFPGLSVAVDSVRNVSAWALVAAERMGLHQ